MTSLRVTIVLFATFMTGSVTPGDLSDAAAAQSASVTFLQATHEKDELLVDARRLLDWEGVARSHFTLFDPFAPDSAGHEEIRRYSSIYGVSDVPYAAPVPSDLESGHYYLIAPTGIHSARPIQLRGTVRYDVNRQGRAQGAPRFSGRLVLESTDSTAGAEGGFVVRLDAALPNGLREQASQSRAAFLARGLPPEPDSTDAAGWFNRTVMEYEFALTPDGPRYLFRQRGSDWLCYEACCRFRYRILQQPGSINVTQVDYGCDI